MIQEIYVETVGEDPLGQSKLCEIKQLGIDKVREVRTIKVYRLEGSEHDAKMFAEALFQEPGLRFWFNDSNELARVEIDSVSIEVAYKPGVMNPEVASLMKAARDLKLTSVRAADSSILYCLLGEHDEIYASLEFIIKRLLVNKTVQHVITQKPETLVIEEKPGSIRIIPIRDMTDHELLALSKDTLFLNLEEMRVIQNDARIIGRDLTDGELETYAQTWSEHCGHKTTKAKLIVNGMWKAPLIERLKAVAKLYYKDTVLSAFHDNSGAALFYDGYAVCGKVETHNSPSAVEPYGGAMTGSGGVYRDIDGTGLGAKVIASTDIFCLADPHLPQTLVPAGCLHPNYLLRRVVAGVRDYGNCMGIPTANGSVHFHPDFRAKPSVIVGAYGIMPVECVEKGVPRSGDRIIAIGGRTGRDGIHGATFSSGEMTDRTVTVNASAVQIGNPYEEKKMFDALLEARDERLVRAKTDCGAGGFASAIGEMGQKTGVRVELEKAPLKYSGLAPWEIWLSESQERMVIAVAPGNVEQFIIICRKHDVEATVLGEFTDDQRLLVTYNGDRLCDLSMDFLHNGLPQRVMKATWTAPVFDEPPHEPIDDWNALAKRIMAHPNVCSKEPIVRMYDHGVQGTNVLPPFVGPEYNGPTDALVLRPLLGKPYGLVISHGLNPVLNKIDPYRGTIWAAVEALSNLVAVGGNIDETWLIDNVIWPFPDEESLGALDRTFDAFVDIMHAFKIPFISGKDSLSGTYRNGETVIKIPPVSCISAFGRIPDVSKTVTSDFKDDLSYILLVGKPDFELGGSVYYDTRGKLGARMSQPDLKNLPALYRNLFIKVQNGRLRSMHDVSEGGILAALTEMCIGGKMGATIDIEGLPLHKHADELLLSECAGCFLVEVTDSEYHSSCHDLPHVRLGRVDKWGRLKINRRSHTLVDIQVQELKDAWQRPMKEVFQ